MIRAEEIALPTPTNGTCVVRVVAACSQRDYGPKARRFARTVCVSPTLLARPGPALKTEACNGGGYPATGVRGRVNDAESRRGAVSALRWTAKALSGGHDAVLSAQRQVGQQALQWTEHAQRRGK